jgi:hypothetical protein
MADTLAVRKGEAVVKASSIYGQYGKVGGTYKPLHQQVAYHESQRVSRFLPAASISSQSSAAAFSTTFRIKPYDLHGPVDKIFLRYEIQGTNAADDPATPINGMWNRCEIIVGNKLVQTIPQDQLIWSPYITEATAQLNGQVAFNHSKIYNDTYDAGGGTGGLHGIDTVFYYMEIHGNFFTQSKWSPNTGVNDEILFKFYADANHHNAVVGAITLNSLEMEILHKDVKDSEQLAMRNKFSSLPLVQLDFTEWAVDHRVVSWNTGSENKTEELTHLRGLCQFIILILRDDRAVAAEALSDLDVSLNWTTVGNGLAGDLLVIPLTDDIVRSAKGEFMGGIHMTGKELLKIGTGSGIGAASDVVTIVGGMLRGVEVRRGRVEKAVQLHE